MVFFNCNACGDALKKNQVEKHYQFKCRSCNVLSCVDCQKEFWGDAYKEHTKCISEEEKYSGKNWKPKANANKGEQKQEAWTQQVIEAIAKCPAGKPKLKDLLKQIEDYPNIPRKKNKFENFVRNSMRIREDYLIAEAWNTINVEPKQQPAPTPDEPKQNGKSSEASTKKQVEQSESTEETDNASSKKKLSKRERKEERQKKQHKADKKRKKLAENGDDDGDDANTEKAAKKRGKKRRRGEEDDDDENDDKNHARRDQAEELEDEPKKKNKKKKKDKSEECDDSMLAEDQVVLNDPALTEMPRPFHWESAILEVLQKSSDQEISLKKLKKKILAEFHSSGGDGRTYTEEKLLSRLNKHILRNPSLKIQKERVKLVS